MRGWVSAFGMTLLHISCAQYPPLPPRPPPPSEELPTEVGWFEASHGFGNAQRAPEVDSTEIIPRAKPSITVKDEVHITAMLQGRQTKELVRISLTMYSRCTECFLGYVHVGGDRSQLYLEDVEQSLSVLEEAALISVVARLGVLCQPCFEEVLADLTTLLPLPSSLVTATTTSTPETISRTTTATAPPPNTETNSNKSSRPRRQPASVLPKHLKSSAVPVPFAEAIPKIPIFNVPLPTTSSVKGVPLNRPSTTVPKHNHQDHSNNNNGNGWIAQVVDWAPFPPTWTPLPLPEINPRILARPSGSALATPLNIGEFDRLGYIRFRKAASTSLQNHLLMRGGVEFCTQKCDFQSCLYAASCNVTLVCEAEDMQLSGYPCSHMGLDMVVENFKVEKDRWARVYQDDPEKLQAVQDGRVYFLTILRDPVKRVISEFFYAKHANVTQDWKGMYPEKIRPSILAGDLKQFAEFGDMNVAMNRMSLQIVKRDYPEPLFFKPVPPNATAEELQEVREAHMQGRRHLISSALHYLRQCRIVLIAEYLSQSLMLLRHVLGKEFTSYIRPLIIRKSPKDQARVATEQDPAVLSAVKSATWADQILYDEAKEMFFSAFKAMLEERGEAVADIHASLAKYHVPGYGVKAAHTSEFPGVKDELPEPSSGFEADGSYYIFVPQPM